MTDNIGTFASGKATAARCLAQDLSLPILDTDDYLKARLAEVTQM